MTAKIINTYTRDDGHIIDEYESGTVRDRTDNKIIQAPPAFQITKENAGAMVERRKQIASAAKVRALARRSGVDVDNATDEEVLKGYGNAQEAIHAKAYDLYMDAKTARGIEAIYPKLADDDRGNDSKKGGDSLPFVTPMTAATALLIERALSVLADMQANQGEVIKVSASEVPAWLHEGEES